MTEVFVTRTGARYHADYHCPAFADAEAEHGHAIHRWPTSLHGIEQTPCAVCWPATGRWDSWTQFVHEVERRGDSPYEAVFVDQVLRHVRDLRPSDALIQQTTRGKSGHTYRIDFVLTAPSGKKVAVEIDGRDKAPGERTVEEVQRDVDHRRADLRAAGWRILNLSNERVANRSHECVTEVESEFRDLVTPGWSGAESEHRAPYSPPATPPAHARAAAAIGDGGGSGAKWIAGALVAAVVATGGWFAFNASAGGSTTAEPNGQSCPTSHPIKGNVSQGGDRIFHRPGWRYYDATWPEDCFATAGEAEDAGYRASEVR